MQYDEKTVKAALSLILDIVAEDKQKIKNQEEAIDHLKTENKNLCEIANDYIRKSDELEAKNKRLGALLEPLSLERKCESK